MVIDLHVKVGLLRAEYCPGGVLQVLAVHENGTARIVWIEEQSFNANGATTLDEYDAILELRQVQATQAKGPSDLIFIAAILDECHPIPRKWCYCFELHRTWMTTMSTGGRDFVEQRHSRLPSAQQEASWGQQQ